MKIPKAIAVFFVLGLPLFAQNVDSLAGKKVVFLGDSITQAGGYVTFTDYYLQKLYPQRNSRFTGLDWQAKRCRV